MKQKLVFGKTGTLAGLFGGHLAVVAVAGMLVLPSVVKADGASCTNGCNNDWTNSTTICVNTAYAATLKAISDYNAAIDVCNSNGTRDTNNCKTKLTTDLTVCTNNYNGTTNSAQITLTGALQNCDILHPTHDLGWLQCVAQANNNFNTTLAIAVVAEGTCESNAGAGYVGCKNTAASNAQACYDAAFTAEVQALNNALIAYNICMDNANSVLAACLAKCASQG